MNLIKFLASRFSKKSQGEKLRDFVEHFEKNKLKIFIGTWNMHGKLPPYDLAPFLEKPFTRKTSFPRKRPYLDRNPKHPYHLIVIGTQECQHNIGHSVFFPSKEEWESRLKAYLGHEYYLVKTETLAALHLAVFVWKECQDWVKAYKHATIPTGIANLFGNKGAIAIALLFGNTSLCFINSHLAAHQSKVKQRTQDIKKISKELKLKGFSKTDKAFDYVHDRFDYVFWFGDMNFRVNQTREEVDRLISINDTASLESLLAYDQLTEQLKTNPILRGFKEAPVTFWPTFKFDITHHNDSKHSEEQLPHSHSAPSIVLSTEPLEYDTSEKRRVPSWTDRIIWKTRVPGADPICVKEYTSHMNVLGFSDHRPVTGCFLVDFDWENGITSNQEDLSEQQFLRPSSIASSSNAEIGSFGQ